MKGLGAFLEKTLFLATLLAAFSLPLLVLPLFSDPLEFPKEIFMIGIAFLFLFPYALLLYIQGKSPSLGTVGKALFLLTLAYLASAIFSQEKYPSFLQAATISSLLLFHLFAKSTITGNPLRKSVFLGVLFSAGGVAASLSILSFFEIYPLGQILSSRNFTSLGSGYALAPFLLFLLTLAAKVFWNSKIWGKTLMVPVGLVLSLGLLFSFPPLAEKINGLIPNSPPYPASPRLSLQTSWQIAAETIRFYPLLGSGPGTFLNDFQRFRPASFNQSKFWDLKFGQADSYLLEILSTLGLLGTFAFLSIFGAAFSTSRNLGVRKEFPQAKMELPYLFLLGLSPLLPFSTPLLFLVFTFPTLFEEAQKQKPSPYRTPPYLKKTALVLTLFLSLSILYSSARAGLAEKYFSQALKDNGQVPNDAVYQNLRRAVLLNPFPPQYRVGIAQVSLGLANHLSQKEELGEEDRNQILLLASQAVEQAKTATTLSPLNSQIWAVRSQIYLSIINVAQGGSQWALETLNRAISLDPQNPLLLVQRGRFLLSAGFGEESEDTLKAAVLAKSDLTSAHYSLAQAYKATQKLDLALSELNTTLTLLEKDFRERGLPEEEYERQKEIVEEEIAGLEKGISEVEEEGPEKIPEGAIQPPLELSPEEGLPQ